MNKIEFEDSEFFFYLPDDWVVLPEDEDTKDNLIRISSLEREVGGATIHIVAEIDPDISVDLVRMMESTLKEQKASAEIKRLNRNTIFCEYLIDIGEGPLWMKRWLMVRKCFVVDALYTSLLTHIETEAAVLDEIMKSICVNPSEIN